MPRRHAVRGAVGLLMLGMCVPFGCMADQSGHTGAETGGPGAGRLGPEQIGPSIGEAAQSEPESGSSSLGGGAVQR